MHGKRYLLQCLRLSQKGIVDTSSGQIVNLMSNDVNKIDMVVYYICYTMFSGLHIKNPSMKAYVHIYC